MMLSSKGGACVGGLAAAGSRASKCPSPAPLCAASLRPASTRAPASTFTSQSVLPACSAARLTSLRGEALRVRASSVDVKQPPTPVVKIDNQSDAFATIVSVQYNEQLGGLMDTVTALKNLNLNIRRAQLKGKETETRFYVTEAATSEKVMKSSRLEEIRMTVLNSLVETFPESADSLGSAVPSNPKASVRKPGKRDVVPTTIKVDVAPNGAASILKINTQDRPGLLVDIVGVLKDINLNVVSAEVDTLGNNAQDEFFVTYHGEPLNGPMVLLVTNALQYYLSLGELATEESY